MKVTDRIVVIALAAVALIAVFWFVLLAPKLHEASDLNAEVERLEGAVAKQRETIAFAEKARNEFPSDYRRLVTLGKAVPEDDDTSSLFAQLTGTSRRAGVGFRALELNETEASGAAPPSATAPSAPESPEDEGTVQQEEQAAGEVPPGEETASSAGAAAPTEAAAASLPIGATVGPAGLPVMPYTLDFQGDFFKVADFMRGLDSLVSLRGGKVRAGGRLLTVDGFVLSRDVQKGFPSLLATLAVTTYLTPPEQGLTGGAGPGGVAPPPEPGATPASSTTTSPQATPAEPTPAATATQGGTP
jgi:hypothetical protein